MRITLLMYEGRVRMYVCHCIPPRAYMQHRLLLLSCHEPLFSHIGAVFLRHRATTTARNKNKSLGAGHPFDRLGFFKGGGKSWRVCGVVMLMQRDVFIGAANGGGSGMKM